MSDIHERAKEEITQALVQEYVRQNPGVNEKDVVMACKEGKLIFSDMASVLAEMKVRKDFSDALENSAKMYSNLTVSENQRWLECYESTDHTRLMLDCLHSSPFQYLDKSTWTKEQSFLKRQENICARATVKLEECKEKLLHLKKKGTSPQKPSYRMIVIDYLSWVIDQLKVLHKVYNKEVEIGDIFEQCSTQYINVVLDKVETKKIPFQINIDNINQIFKSLKGDRKSKLISDDITELNKKMLLESKKTMEQSIDDLKSHLHKRREQFQEIWSTITTMQHTLKKMKELNKLDQAGKLAPEDGDADDQQINKRMARFLKKMKDKFNK